MQGIDNIALNFTNKTSDELQAQRVQREEEPIITTANKPTEKVKIGDGEDNRLVGLLDLGSTGSEQNDIISYIIRKARIGLALI